MLNGPIGGGFKIDNYWNPQLHALLILGYTSQILLFTV